MTSHPPYSPNGPHGPQSHGDHGTSGPGYDYGTYNVYNYYGVPPVPSQPPHMPQPQSPVPTPAPYASTPPRTAAHQSKNKAPRILAWTGAILGLMFITMVPEMAVSAADGTGQFLMGVGFLIPSLWWFYCENADKKAVEHWQERVRAENELKASLGDGYDVVTAGMGSVEPPRYTQRRWPHVTALALIVFFVGGAFVEPTEETPGGDETTTSDSSAHNR